MNILKTMFLRFFPILIFSVRGKSMEPTFVQGQKVVGIASWFVTCALHDVVICQDPRTKKLILKRIAQIKNGYFYVQGDNKEKSTDSRTFGLIQKKDIFAKIIYPKTVYNT